MPPGRFEGHGDVHFTESGNFAPSCAIIPSCLGFAEARHHILSPPFDTHGVRSVARVKPITVRPERGRYGLHSADSPRECRRLAW